MPALIGIPALTCGITRLERLGPIPRPSCDATVPPGSNRDLNYNGRPHYSRLKGLLHNLA